MNDSLPARHRHKIKELSARIDDWFLQHNDEANQGNWAHDYLKKRPLRDADLRILDSTKQGVTAYLASARNKSELDALVTKMKGAWRIHKLRQRYTNVSIFISKQDNQILRKACKDRQKSPSDIISDLLTGFLDDYKQIKREEKLNHEERETKLRLRLERQISDKECKIKSIEFKHKWQLAEDHRKLTAAILDLRSLANDIIQTLPTKNASDSAVASSYKARVQLCIKGVNKYLEPPEEVETATGHEPHASLTKTRRNQ
ncbi:hypothetical protein LH51_01015 [Nitrincola sp. A-D6]|uniref:hypothetical protein n=1 Tax=Nitrincola sp. A-D6 TaxID=1545442 RepID=UPI00051FA4A7|nr:hypothetical protein [Nitrincola sp. A-D6]KGK43250.1 hypothetical protein LH51_01015 [Nitrincola sp. A-D6]